MKHNETRDISENYRVFGTLSIVYRVITDLLYLFLKPYILGL
jgi:hypothetical protein